VSPVCGPPREYPRVAQKRGAPKWSPRRGATKGAQSEIPQRGLMWVRQGNLQGGAPQGSSKKVHKGVLTRGVPRRGFQKWGSHKGGLPRASLQMQSQSGCSITGVPNGRSPKSIPQGLQWGSPKVGTKIGLIQRNYPRRATKWRQPGGFHQRG
jgi:hypothetical protein